MKEKPEQKTHSKPIDLSLEDFEALVRRYGYIDEGGKHPKAVIGKEILSYKKRNPMHRIYVQCILSLIDAFEKSGENDDRQES